MSGEHSNANIIYKGGPHCCGNYGGYVRRARWVITDKYIERQIGICCPSIDNLQLLRVRDISFKDTCCCCGYCGVITIISTDSTGTVPPPPPSPPLLTMKTDPEMQIAGLPNSKAIYKGLRDAVDKIHKGAKLELGS